jgi:hypothetical protein
MFFENENNLILRAGMVRITEWRQRPCVWQLYLTTGKQPCISGKISSCSHLKTQPCNRCSFHRRWFITMNANLFYTVVSALFECEQQYFLAVVADG